MGELCNVAGELNDLVGPISIFILKAPEMKVLIGKTRLLIVWSMQSATSKTQGGFEAWTLY